MAALIFLLYAALVIGAQSRFIIYEIPDEFETDVARSLDEDYSGRSRRDVGGAVSTNPDGTANVNFKAKLAGTDSNVLSAIAGVDALKSNGKYQGATGGLALENM